MRRLIKLMFINTINPAREVEYRYPPLGLGYLVSSLREYFGEDSFIFEIVYEDIEQALTDFMPDVVGITTVSQNYNLAKEYANIAKRKKIPVIIGGPHISILPSSLTPDMDVGVIGEGEQTIIELMELFKTAGRFEEDELKRIKGICYRKEGRVEITPKRDLIPLLDGISPPARDMFKSGKSTYMFTSRGCLYRCVFCASCRLWDKVRFFSAEYVVNEIKELIDKWKVKYIEFYDDLFILNKQRLIKLVSLIRKESIQNYVQFGCAVRANLVNDEIAYLLKEMNVINVRIGLESGCAKTLKYLKGSSVTVDDNRNVLVTFRRHNMTVYGSFIIGSPNESKEDILETLSFIKRNNLQNYTVYLLTPLPGTPVWEYAKKRGLVSDDMDWSKLDLFFKDICKRAVILSETLDREELYELFLKFERHKRYIWIKNATKKALIHPFWAFKFLVKRIKEKL